MHSGAAVHSHAQLDHMQMHVSDRIDMNEWIDNDDIDSINAFVTLERRRTRRKYTKCASRRTPSQLTAHNHRKP